MNRRPISGRSGFHQLLHELNEGMPLMTMRSPKLPGAHTIRIAVLAAMLMLGRGGVAVAQSTGSDGWAITVYPLLAWVPLHIGIDVDVPPFDGDGGAAGDIIDSQFDGAFFGGVAASNGVWRIEGYGLWASFGGDRPQRPSLVVDLDIIYGDAKLGRRVAPDLFVTGGVRRVALKYDITLGDLPHLAREPGVWDPLIGIGWHRAGPKVEWHASFDAGGFGAGADVDLGASFRVDWKPVRHFGLTAGYNLLYLKVTDSVLGRTVTVEPTVHGPMAGFGLYF
jgi:hypothetical protein